MSISTMNTFETANTVNTVDTVMAEPTSNLEMTLGQLCSLIEEHRSLQSAEIITTEGYAQQIGPVTHRFLVLELRRASKKTIFLRLDRRAGRTVLSLMFSLGSAPACDKVRHWFYSHT